MGITVPNLPSQQNYGQWPGEPGLQELLERIEALEAEQAEQALFFTGGPGGSVKLGNPGEQRPVEGGPSITITKTGLYSVNCSCRTRKETAAEEVVECIVGVSVNGGAIITFIDNVLRDGFDLRMSGTFQPVSLKAGDVLTTKGVVEQNVQVIVDLVYISVQFLHE